MSRTPVVLIHGVWLHMTCWEGWAGRFTAHGYDVNVPNWPGEARDAARARRDPGPMRDLGLDELTEHFVRIVRDLERPPVVIGHSVGGLIAQYLLGAGLAEAAVALAPQPLPGVAAVEVRPTLADRIWGSPAGYEGFVPLLRPRFRHTVANAVGEEEAGRLFDRYAIPAPERLVAELMPEPWDRPDSKDQPESRDQPDSRDQAEQRDDVESGAATGAGTGFRLAVRTDNTARGPLLLVSGQEDRIVPDAVTRSVYKLYGDNVAVTDLKQYPDRGHSLVMDSGWRPVADHVLGWLADHGVRPAAPKPPAAGHERFI